MSDCVFCKIIAWEIPCAKVWEDESFIVFLDVFPVCKWMTLVVPKKHCTSNFADVNKWAFVDIMKVSHNVANMLKKWLWVERVGMVVEWLDVDHLHIKLYPFYKENWKTVGFVNGTWWWPKADFEELQELAEKLRS